MVPDPRIFSHIKAVLYSNKVVLPQIPSPGHTVSEQISSEGCLKLSRASLALLHVVSLSIHIFVNFGLLVYSWLPSAPQLWITLGSKHEAHKAFDTGLGSRVLSL